MIYTIYHNPRCQKSRQTLELLQKHKIEPTIVEYLKVPFQKKELKAVLDMLKLKPSQLIRTKEEKIKSLKINLADEEKVLTAMLEHPELIERPIVVCGNKAVLGRPPENVLLLMGL